MTKTEDEKLKDLLNASGFVFQLALEDAIRRAPLSGQWRITGREQHWTFGGDSGFIDLILSFGNTHLLIECKRTRGATWLFLMSDKEQMDRTHARICWTDTAPNRRPLAGWGDTQIYPASPEPSFCVVRGQGERDAPLLERLATAVVTSADGLASEFLKLENDPNDTNLIVPVIVTTASLYLGAFDPVDANLGTGEIDKVAFSKVQSVRFRKSLAPSEVPIEYEAESLRDLSAASERTVLVVEASSFLSWLRDLQFQATTSSSPWILARKRTEATGG